MMFEQVLINRILENGHAIMYVWYRNPGAVYVGRYFVCLV